MKESKIADLEKKAEDLLCDLTLATDYQGLPCDLILAPLIDEFRKRFDRLRKINDGTKNENDCPQSP